MCSDLIACNVTDADFGRINVSDTPDGLICTSANELSHV